VGGQFASAPSTTNSGGLVSPVPRDWRPRVTLILPTSCQNRRFHTTSIQEVAIACVRWVRMLGIIINVSATQKFFPRRDSRAESETGHRKTGAEVGNTVCGRGENDWKLITHVRSWMDAEYTHVAWGNGMNGNSRREPAARWPDVTWSDSGGCIKVMGSGQKELWLIVTTQQHTLVNCNIRWPSVLDFPGQSPFLTTCTGKISQFSRDVHLSHFWHGVPICPSLQISGQKLAQYFIRICQQYVRIRGRPYIHTCRSYAWSARWTNRPAPRASARGPW